MVVEDESLTQARRNAAIWTIRRLYGFEIVLVPPNQSRRVFVPR
jgi:hypothetical protein